MYEICNLGLFSSSFYRLVVADFRRALWRNRLTKRSDHACQGSLVAGVCTFAMLSID